MNNYPNDDQHTTFDTPEELASFGDFVHDLAMPGWATSYASPEARARFEQWTATPAAAKCIHCGKVAIDMDGTLAPARWAEEDETFKPHCAACHQAEMGGVNFG